MKLQPLQKSKIFQNMEIIQYLEMMATEIEKKEKCVISWANTTISKNTIPDVDIFLQDTTLLQSFFDKVYKEINIDEQTLLKYFSILEQDLESHFLSTAGILFVGLPTNCKELNCSEIQALYTILKYQFLLEDEKEVYIASEDIKICNEDEFWKYIETSTLPDDKKWKALQLTKYWNKYQEEISIILEKAWKIYNKNLPMLNPLLEKYLPEIELAIENYDEKNWSEIYSFNFEVNENINCYCSFAKFNSLSLVRVLKDNEQVYVISNGIFFQTVRKISLEQTNTDNISKMLKVLGETRKFEILLSLLESPCNGKELAQRLELTPATISHHISPMIQNGIVILNRANSKYAYYQVNTIKIQENLDRLKIIFKTNNTENQ